MNASEKLSAPLRGAEHYNQIDPSTNVRKTLDTTCRGCEQRSANVSVDHPLVAGIAIWPFIRKRRAEMAGGLNMPAPPGKAGRDGGAKPAPRARNMSRVSQIRPLKTTVATIRVTFCSALAMAVTTGVGAPCVLQTGIGPNRSQLC